MATLRQVERGTVSLPAATASVTATLSTTLLDTSKALLIFSYQPAAPRSDRGAVRGVITNTTTLTFDRGSATSAPAITIEYQVVEWTAGVTVQRGSTSMVSVTSVDVTIASVNTAKAFVLLGGEATGLGNWIGSTFVGASLTSGTNLHLERWSQNTSAIDVAWQVVEYDGCTVQSGSIAALSTEGSKTATVTSVDTTQSWLLMSYANNSSVSTAIGEKLWRGAVTNSTTLTFTREATAASGAAATLWWFLVEFTDATTVQRGQLAFTSESSKTATLTAVATSRAVVIGAGNMSTMGSTPKVDVADPSVTTFQLTLTNSTTLTAARGATGSNGTLEWYAIEFPSAVTTIAPGGIASAEAFGAARADLTVHGSGLGTAEAFGAASVGLGVSVGGIASAEAFGSLALGLGAAPVGIASTETFGTASLALGVSLTGIASAEAFGVHTVGVPALVITPSGIVSAEIFGTASLVQSWRFTPPTLTFGRVPHGRWIPPYVRELLEHVPAVQRGKNVHIKAGQVFTEGTQDDHLAADYVYLGARSYVIGKVERDILVAAGYVVESG